MITLFIKLFRAMNYQSDYVESDEWEIKDWQDLHNAIEAWKR